MRTPYERALASLSRREFLNVAWKLGTAAALLPLSSQRLWASPVFDSYPFTLGVASGDPLPDGIVLWTRLAPKPLEGGGLPNLAIDVQWEIGFDEQMHTLAQTGTATAYAELGHAVHVDIAGLESARDYWYRFVVGGIQSPIGKTRTAPERYAPVDQIKIGVCGCNHYEQGYFTAYRHMANENFDVIFHTGDYIYEYAPYDGLSSRVRKHLGEETFSLNNYRNRYAQYKLDPDLQAVHASAPFVATWDDHEIDNDWAAEFSETNTPPEIFKLRRAAAFQAYYEAMPLRRTAFPSAGHLQLYRQLHFGDLMSVNVLDTRQYRSRQACREHSASSCLEYSDADRSMLGGTQEQWLKSNLSDSVAHWNVLAQQVPMFGREATPGNTNNPHVMDKWSGYPAARERLVNDISAANLKNVVVLSGDIHSHWAADVPADMSHPDGPSVAVELTTTSISSGGDGSEIAGYWPDIQPSHPHVHHHSNRRGYLSCQISPDRWQSDFMVMDTVTSPDGQASPGARMVVERNNPTVIDT
ncbi:alkaline phosphatase D family protein [Granulosicoccus antarcticus]|uniref:Alkaline phosphatase D n=1 Tax=Granulosicoccus antarcticus IMCC3135 TaxID=1192854 RepID=A0A2Z2P5F5_9GAMM|nr:alkaline phosphatase D family protein [Granulosicoccus antarcticus]ASJ76730.1 Alkaline phosphatase D [Granulosicoccus antarcticus IMCC3135]